MLLHLFTRCVFLKDNCLMTIGIHYRPIDQATCKGWSYLWLAVWKVRLISSGHRWNFKVILCFIIEQTDHTLKGQQGGFGAGKKANSGLAWTMDIFSRKKNQLVKNWENEMYKKINSYEYTVLREISFWVKLWKLYKTRPMFFHIYPIFYWIKITSVLVIFSSRGLFFPFDNLLFDLLGVQDNII